MLPIIKVLKSAALLAFTVSGSCTALADTISGIVLSINDTPVSGALVIVTDSKTGIPVTNEGIPGDLSSERASAISDQSGKFSLEVSPGTYNIIAQQWVMPNHSRKHMLLPLIGHSNAYGPVVTAAGGTPNLQVPSAAASNLEMKPPGGASLIVEVDSANDNGIVVVSRKPVNFDPVLGFAGWIGDFLANAIAFNTTPATRQIRFENLPQGPVHVAIYGNDNLPGFGAATVNLTNETTTTVQVEWIGHWSNARKTPPPELLPIFEKFKTGGWKFNQIPGLVKIEPQEMRNALRMHELLTSGSQQLLLPDGTTATPADLYEVRAYLLLNKSHK